MHLFDIGSSEPSTTLRIPYNPTSPPQLITLHSHSPVVSILGVTPSAIAVFHLDNTASPPTLQLHSTSSLPLPSPPSIILPVDPMARAHGALVADYPPNSPISPIGPSFDNPSPSHGKHVRDALASISASGRLAFWIPNESEDVTNGATGWVCTGSIETGRTDIRLARCSSAKKTAIVSLEDGVEQLTIWDSKESEFSSGLEYNRQFDEPIHDLDWTSTDTDESLSILAVGFTHRVVLFAQQRTTYFDQEATWMVLGDIDLTKLVANRFSSLLFWTY